MDPMCMFDSCLAVCKIYGSHFYVGFLVGNLQDLKGPISTLVCWLPVCKIVGLIRLIRIFGWSPATSVPVFEEC